MITAPACYQLLKTVALGNSAGTWEQFQPQESHAHSCSFTICLKPRWSKYFVKIPGCPLIWCVPSAAPVDVNLYVTDSVYQFVFFIFEGLWIPPLNSSSGGYGALGTHWKYTPLHFCTQRSGEMTVLNHVFEQDQVNKKINIISSLFPRNLPYPFYCQQLGTGREVTSEMRGLQTPNLEFPSGFSPGYKLLSAGFQPRGTSQAKQSKLHLVLRVSYWASQHCLTFLGKEWVLENKTLPRRGAYLSLVEGLLPFWNSFWMFLTSQDKGLK